MMYRIALPVLCMTAIALAACGGSNTEPEPTTAPSPVIDTEAIEEIAEEAGQDMGEAVEEAAEETEAAMDEAAEELAEAAEDAEQAIEMDGPVLTGTSWQAGDYTLEFKSVDEVVDGTTHGTVQAKGGEIPAFMTNGMEFSYTLDPDGNIEISTPQGSFNGTYDGEELILEDSPATLLEQ